MSLRERLEAEIARAGPITVAQYMTACLHDPTDGYYATRPALGEDGDFVTAPLISQMFGELVGIWAASAWALMGEPAGVRLVEMGPGDGTLMVDVLRAARPPTSGWWRPPSPYSGSSAAAWATRCAGRRASPTSPAARR